ncbi:MAG: hypothetical protein ACE5I5_04685 [Candidatus Heimdallarchaeota archaeon]
MRKKIFAVSIVFLFALNLYSIVGAASPLPSSMIQEEDPNYVGVDWQSGLAGNIEMPKITGKGKGPKSANTQSESTPPVGTWVYDWYVGAVSGNPYIQLRAVVGNAEVWVANDDALMFPEGDPRNDDPLNWQVTDEMAQYMAEEFNSAIYPSVASTFGAPLDRDGTGTIFEALGWPSFTYDWIETNNPQRVIIKIFNIHDDNYFDPDYPYYVVGFYSPLYTQDYYIRNMVHIDNWRWWQRLGPEGTQWYPEHKKLTVNRPHVYESTVAHEFQHNLHDDWNPDDPSFMNEGCSMYAEMVSGYGIEPSYFNSYFATPDNSLTEWGDQGDINILADYGVAALWTIYLSDHYGGSDFIRYFVQAGTPGIEGINAALKKFHFKKGPGEWMTFDDVYHDWRIANLLRSDVPGDGKYNYQSIDLNDPEIIPVMTNDVETPFASPTTGSDFGSTITILGYDTGVYKVGAYGSDYVSLENMKTVDKFDPILMFDGDDFAGAGWIREDMDGDGDLEWYSTTAGSLKDLSIIGEVTLPTEPVTVTFDTYFNIEPFWDFGFVQVSADGGATWTSLENADTTYEHDPGAHPDIVANLPGFTGSSDGWVTETFDLSAWVDTTVMLRFRYMTDWAVQNPGWWVDNIAINGDLIDNADTTVTFELVPPLPETDFMVTVIGNGRVEDISLDDLTETGMEDLSRFIGKGSHGRVLIIISPNEGPADYTFSVTKQ